MTNDLLKRIRVLNPPMSRAKLSTMTTNQLSPWIGSTPLDPGSKPKEALDWITGTRFQVGDIVTRDGTDRQRIIDIGDGGDNMLVECIKAPLGWLNEDGSRDPPWCEVGDEEWNLPRRYSYPEELVVEGESSGSPYQALK